MSTSSPGPRSGVATRRRSDAMAAAAGRGAVFPPLGRAARECCGAAGSGRALPARASTPGAGAGAPARLRVHELRGNGGGGNGGRELRRTDCGNAAAAGPRARPPASVTPPPPPPPRRAEAIEVTATGRRRARPGAGAIAARRSALAPARVATAGTSAGGRAAGSGGAMAAPGGAMWIPAFAGMTGSADADPRHSGQMPLTVIPAPPPVIPAKAGIHAGHPTRSHRPPRSGTRSAGSRPCCWPPRRSSSPRPRRSRRASPSLRPRPTAPTTSPATSSPRA